MSSVHPLIAGILDQSAQLPAQVRRAEYVSRLIRMDWQFEFADDARPYRAGRDELMALRQLQIELDPTAQLWNRHVPAQYRATRMVSVKCKTADGAISTTWITTNAPNIDVSAVMMEMHGIGTRVDVSDAQCVPADGVVSGVAA